MFKYEEFHGGPYTESRTWERDWFFYLAHGLEGCPPPGDHPHTSHEYNLDRAGYLRKNGH